jgi:hypothetical protein
MPSANVRWPVPLIRQKPFYPGLFGVPGTDNTRGQRSDANGVVFYVDPNASGVSDLRDGTDPEGPLQTVGKALTLCRPYMNDIIAVMPNSYWTHADTTQGRATPIGEQVTVSVPGVRIVGVMPPSSIGIPWVPIENDGVCIRVTAIDVVIEGFCFRNAAYTGGTGIHAIWGGAGVGYGDNLTVRHCFFCSDLDYGVRTDFSYNSYIEDCYFQSIGIAAIENPGTQGDPDWIVIRRNIFTGCAVAIDLDDTDYVVIEDNEIIACPTGIVLNGGAYAKIKNNVINTTQGAGVVAIDGEGLTESVIHGNVINAAPGGTRNMIDLNGGATNIVSDNWLSCTILQYDTTCEDATSGSWVNNHCTDGSPVAPPT